MRNLYSFKNCFKKYLITKGKSNFVVEKFGRHTLFKLSELTSLALERMETVLIGCNESRHTCVIVLHKMPNLSLITKKPQTNTPT